MTDTTDRYRKRPVEIEARQWDGTADGATRIIDWVLGGGSTANYVCSNPDRCSENDGDTPHSISIRTLEGDMRAGLGDWIIRGVAGEFYPCRNDIFAATYEPAAAPVVPPADRAAVALTEAERTMLRFALDQAQEKIWSEDGFTDEDQAAVTSLRRMTGEAQPDDEGLSGPCDCGEGAVHYTAADCPAELRRVADEAQPFEADRDSSTSPKADSKAQPTTKPEPEAQAPDTDPVYDPRAWETYRRDAGCGCTAPAPVDCKIPHGTGAWLCVCHRLSGPEIKESDPPGKPLAVADAELRKHFQEPNRCLSMHAGIFRCARPIGHAGDHRAGRTFWGRRAEDEQAAVVSEPGKET